MSTFHLFFDALATQLVARDLERLQRGWLPGPAELDLAPVLLDWSFHPHMTPALRGQAFNHPDLGNARIVTSPLVAIDIDGRWARTKSRWYRLQSTSERSHG